MIRDIFSLLKANKKLLFLIIGLLTAVIVLAVITSLNKPVTKTQKTSEVAPIDTPAVIVGGKDLYAKMKNDVRYRNLRADLAQYARKSLEIKSEPIVFEVSTDITTKDTSIVFSGFFTDNKRQKLEINLTPKNNDRTQLNVSQNGTDVSSKFQSNNQRNKYIERLPDSKGDFEITYDSSTELFIATLYERTQINQKLAEDHIKKEIGSDTEDSIQYIFPTYSPGSTPTEDVEFDGASLDFGN